MPRTFGETHLDLLDSLAGAAGWQRFPCWRCGLAKIPLLALRAGHSLCSCLLCSGGISGKGEFPETDRTTAVNFGTIGRSWHYSNL